MQATETRRRATDGARKCKLVKADKVFKDGKIEELVSCEFMQEDLPDDEDFQMLEVTFLQQSDIDELDLGGESTLTVSDSTIDEAKNELMVPKGAQIRVDHVPEIEVAPRNTRRLAIAGNREVLVIRETRTSPAGSVLSDQIFGTFGDRVNLASQYAACSYNQLTFSPWAGNGRPSAIVTDGVLTVSITDTIQGSSDATVRDAMLSKATRDLGGTPLNQLVDFVMLCIPADTLDGWLIYSYFDHWLSGTLVSHR